MTRNCKAYFLLTSIIFISICHICVYGGTNSSKSAKQANLSEIKAKYNAMVDELISSIKHSNDAEYKLHAFITLGELRAEKAIPFLLANMDFMPPGDWKYTFGLPPAGYALTLIGTPSTKFIIKEIKNFPDSNSVEDKDKMVYLTAVFRISCGRGGGHTDQIALIYLDEEIKHTKAPKQIKNLIRSKKLINKWQQSVKKNSHR